jgi:hypothetical protein
MGEFCIGEEQWITNVITAACIGALLATHAVHNSYGVSSTMILDDLLSMPDQFEAGEGMFPSSLHH